MRLLLRADGDAAIGTGHVMRCLALAQAWCRHGDAALVSDRLAPALARRARAVGVRVLESPEADDPAGFAELVKREQADVIVLDGYHLPPGLARSCPEIPSLLIDDHGRTGWHGTSGILDGNLAAEGTVYPRQVPALVGPRYALLRPSFMAPGRHEATAPRGSTGMRGDSQDAPSVLVTLGGGTSPTLLRTIAEALKRAAVPATFLLGATQEDASLLERELTGLGATVHRDVQDTAPFFRQHDLAIVAAGTTVLEAAATGTPVLALSQAENQSPVLEKVVACGIGRSLGPAAKVDPATVEAAVRQVRNDSSWLLSAGEQGLRLVDGRGARRAVAWLRSRTLTLRDATVDDRDQVLHWANDATTRSMSFRSDAIQPAEHAAWWAQRLEDPDSHLFIAERDRPLGFVWFSTEKRSATISVNIAPGSRGGGWGPAVIRAATDLILQRQDVGEVLAWTKTENKASQAAFLDADFDRAGPDGPDGALLFKRTRGG